MQLPMPTLLSIETNRLLLRGLNAEDAPYYFSLENDPAVKRFLGGPSGKGLQFYRSRIVADATGLATTLAVTSRTSGEFFGRCGFTEYADKDPMSATFGEKIGWEINVVLSRHCPKRQGYATEIGLVLIPRGFEALGCNKILGIADEANVASHGLCSKLGMKFDRNTTRYGRPARVYTIEKQA